MSTYMIDDAIPHLIGRKLAAIRLDGNKARIVLAFEDGGTHAFRVEGDCCSTSWIEHLEMPDNIAGATLLAVEDSDKITSDHPDHDEENGGNSISVYNTRFRTDRGDVVLEYRNSSNGYYGGYLTDGGKGLPDGR
jgi:hypothetical protein